MRWIVNKPLRGKKALLPRCGVLFVTIWLIAATTGPLWAHPLGNFTINHLTKLTVTAQRVDVHYVLDMAEIPTFQALRAATADGKMNAAQLERWARREAAVDMSQLQLLDAGSQRTLLLDSSRATTRPGAGGLPTLYLALEAHAFLTPSAKSFTLAYSDQTYPGRLGWHDIVVAPATEPTHELTRYPSAYMGSPRATTAVEINLDSSAHTIVHATSPLEAAVGGVPSVSQVRSNQLSDMLARGANDWSVVLLTLLVAIALGALHALEPGHGKTLLAISLVGARATVKQATILALALTVAHTIGVLVLGLAINLFKGYFVPEAIYPWIMLGSGIIIAIIGARAVRRQIDGRQPHAHVHSHTDGYAAQHMRGHEHVNNSKANDHVHNPKAHDHDHAQGHVRRHDHADDDIVHAHSHAIPGSAPLRFGSTVWAAMSGGVAPCPAALVVLLAAVALNQVAYGILVIVAFSFGLAVTLTGVGIAVVRGASWLAGRPQFERLVRFGPLASAIVISTIGAAMVGQSFVQQGTGVSPIAIRVLVALAIAGYAFTHPVTHRRAEAVLAGAEADNGAIIRTT
jgi:nickel/cobalt exporter